MTELIVEGCAPERAKRSALRSGGRAARVAARGAPLADNIRPVRAGMSGGQYKPLTEAGMQRIHQAALDALETIGLADAPPTGIEIMTRAGYDPVAAINVLEKLQRFKGNDPRAELLFSTHPSPSERLDMLLQAGVDKLPRPAAKPNPNRQARFQKFIEAI